MTTSGWEQLAFVVAVTAVCAALLGRYLAAVFRGGAAPGDRMFLPVERLVYRGLGVDPESSWSWRAYALAVLAFGLLSALLLYGILRLQGVLPLNPDHAPGMSPLLSFNTAISFITGTNWQAYEGETQASYLADMAGLVVAQFIAAGVGLAVALAVIRGISGRARKVGNFWSDFTRSLTRVLIPLSVAGALVMVWQGAVQNFSGFRTAATLAGATQKILAVMAVIFLGHTMVSMQAEAHGSYALPSSVSQSVTASNPGGDMEGKETRFGPEGSALMTVGTMGTTAGATDSALDSYTPVGGTGAFAGILLGEISPGGDGGGLYCMLVLALLAVFLARYLGGRFEE